MERTYILRSGRMTSGQRRARETLLPTYKIAFQGDRAGKLDFSASFGNTKPVVVEIGFGMGIATAQIALSKPDTNFVGIEVHRPGIGSLLLEIEKHALQNVRIIEHNAVEVFEHIKDASLEGVHLFFPDPWPKKRHHKRRIVQSPFTKVLAAKLKACGYIYFVTDWSEYAEWARQELLAVPGMVCTDTVPSWRAKTKFECRALAEGRAVHELFFVKESLCAT